MRTVTLHDGHELPTIGFGVFEVPADVTARLCGTALQVGYRHIDTARLYGNEEAVGQAVRDSGLAVDDVFVTTKIWNDDQGYDEARAAFAESSQRLDLGTIDLVLIHWPKPAADKYLDTWRALIDLQQEGQVRSIGVSNFHESHLRRIIDETGVTPVVNQIECHPYLQQRELRAVNAQLGIVTEAWSPLARGREVLGDPVIGAIADKHGKSAAQVILRWHLDLDSVVLARSQNDGRIAENFDVFGFELDEADHAAIAGLDRGGRIGPDPDVF